MGQFQLRLKTDSPATEIHMKFATLFFVIFTSVLCDFSLAQSGSDFLRRQQFQAIGSNFADWGYWGTTPSKYTGWTSHSNRLIPIYVFGTDLESYKDSNSVYRRPEQIEQLYGQLPIGTLNPTANYLDQTDVCRIQADAIAAGKKYVFLVIFDGMDYETTRSAAIYKQNEIAYRQGRGRGLSFLDYRGVTTDYGFFVSSAHNDGTDHDVNSQIIKNPGGIKRGGYNVEQGGSTPWSPVVNPTYLIGSQRDLPHVVTDSAASATSMNSGIKTYNGSINIAPDGREVVPLARRLQQDGFAVGAVTSVPISHATPAATYANNVSREDYQDLTRDLLGVKSVLHRSESLNGMDVVIGAGWGKTLDDDRTNQGRNYVPGNQYLAERDLESIDVENGGRYVVALRTEGELGSRVLGEAARKAAKSKSRLFGYFGVAEYGHLPYQTADGKFDPTQGEESAEHYTDEDISENPTLAEMTSAAISVLQAKGERGFWLMVEAGDVDWANHNNNIDDSIGAVFSGESAFDAITNWAEANNAWEDTIVIVTADHGHYFELDRPEVLLGGDPVVTEGANEPVTEGDLKK